MKNQFQRRPSASAFTLIEMLIVIAIIAVLAGMVLGVTGAYNKNRIHARARAQIAELATAIDRYQQKKGFYPPDVPGKPSTNQLLYELWGATPTPDGQGFTLDFAQGDTIPTNLFGAFFLTHGILNSSPDKKEVDNFISNFKQDKVKNINVNTPTTPVWVFFFPSKGPNDVVAVNNEKVNLINYVASNPKHNANTYDLWIDVIVGGKTNRISNWSSEAEKNVLPY